MGNLYIADTDNNVIRKVTNINDVEEVRKESSFSIYPNPSNGTLTISASQAIDEIKITDILGQVVYTEKPRSQNANLQIENAGVYFVSVKSGNKITTQKIIVSR